MRIATSIMKHDDGNYIVYDSYGGFTIVKGKLLLECVGASVETKTADTWQDRNKLADECGRLAAENKDLRATIGGLVLENERMSKRLSR